MTPTASTFREAVLQHIGAKTGLVAGVTVPMKEILPLVYASTGYTEDQFGKDNHGYFKVRLWVQQAFNKLLRKQGLGENAGRGKWTLTDEGVVVAATLLGLPVPAPVVAPVDDSDDVEDIDLDALLEEFTDGDDTTVADTVADTVVPVAAHDGGEGVAWTLGEQVNKYNPDPYIRGLAIEATKCFGAYSGRSAVCKSCPLSGGCKAVVIGQVADLAVAFRKRDEDAARKAAQPADTVKAPVDDSDDSDDIDDIDDIIKAIEDEVEEPKTKADANVRQMTIPADAKCRGCGKKAARGTEVIYVRGSGIYHKDCYKGGNP